MNNVDILPADTYLVMNKTVIHETDKTILVMLYQPIIGATAVNLYFTLKNDLDQLETMSTTFTHHHLMTSTHYTMSDILKAREILEAVGLLKTYFKKDQIHHYVYELYSPLSAYDFFNHPLLNPLLQEHVGTKEYERVLNYFKLPNIDLVGYQNISKKFSDIFQTVTHSNQQSIDGIKNKTRNSISIDHKIDFEFVKASFQEHHLGNVKLDANLKEVMNQLAFLYGIDTMQMISILRTVLNEKGIIDIEKLRQACRNYFGFEHGTTKIHMIYKSQPDTFKKEIKDKSEKTKYIHLLETITPYDLMVARNNGATPTNRDMHLVEGLLVDLKLNPGVVNVLIDYVLRINDNKLNKNYVEAIASQWKRINIKTVSEAMQQAEKEYNKEHVAKIPTSKKQVVKVPTWFDKEIAVEKDEDTEKELQDVLKEFGR